MRPEATEGRDPSAADAKPTGTKLVWLAWASAMLVPVLAGVAGWIWAELTTSQAACSRDSRLGGPGLGGSALLVALALVPVLWRARRARLSSKETIGLLVTSIVFSVFLIALAVAVWEIGHHCAD
ncbi:MAG: hypothetical protein M3071_16360 [Actinomycetota bacterium]|nr:hypothetical protein [Actinomycetota bacterium]